jgi:predicted lactoylglutathione lyase
MIFGAWKAWSYVWNVMGDAECCCHDFTTTEANVIFIMLFSHQNFHKFHEKAIQLQEVYSWGVTSLPFGVFHKGDVVTIFQFCRRC